MCAWRDKNSGLEWGLKGEEASWERTEKDIGQCCLKNRAQVGSKENDKQIQLERKDQEDKKKFKTAPKCQLMWITKKMLKRKKSIIMIKRKRKGTKPGNSIKT